MYFKPEKVQNSWILPLTWGTNNTYFGQINESKSPHGNGIKIGVVNFKQFIYEGNFYKDEYQGKGRLISSEGSLYNGDWIDGKKHGKGYICIRDAIYYEGDWKNDKYNGFGHCWTNLGYHCEGQFRLGKAHGLIREYGNKYSFYGFFKNGVRDGKGWFTSLDERQYIGDFTHNCANGKCTIKYENGNYFKGNVINFKKIGQGIFVDKNIGIYKGEFKNGRAEGDFLLIKNDGEQQKIIAMKGHFIGIMDEILTNLYLGCAKAAEDDEELKKKGIKNIVSVLYDENVQKVPDINYHIISVKDSEEENISQYFCEAIKFIHSLLIANEKVLVHCYQGISRSATIVIAYIMASQKCDLESALKIVKEKRKYVFPNSGFMKQLKTFDYSSLCL